MSTSVAWTYTLIINLILWSLLIQNCDCGAVACSAGASCSCPADDDCQITCASVGGCKRSKVFCDNTGYDCNVHCDGFEACWNTTIKGKQAKSLTIT
eukprot:266061_1